MIEFKRRISKKVDSIQRALATTFSLCYASNYPAYHEVLVLVCKQIELNKAKRARA